MCISQSWHMAFAECPIMYVQEIWAVIRVISGILVTDSWIFFTHLLQCCWIIGKNQYLHVSIHDKTQQRTNSVQKPWTIFCTNKTEPRKCYWFEFQRNVVAVKGRLLLILMWHLCPMFYNNNTVMLSVVSRATKASTPNRVYAVQANVCVNEHKMNF